MMWWWDLGLYHLYFDDTCVGYAMIQNKSRYMEPRKKCRTESKRTRCKSSCFRLHTKRDIFALDTMKFGHRFRWSTCERGVRVSGGSHTTDSTSVIIVNGGELVVT
jgi:hypothetical protein